MALGYPKKTAGENQVNGLAIAMIKGATESHGNEKKKTETNVEHLRRH